MPRPNTNEYHDIAGTGITMIITEKGAIFLIDTADQAIGQRHCWSLHEHGYARAVARTKDGRRKTIYLHRLLCQTSVAQPHVDHISGIEFDCRSQNLRACNRQQNLRNQRLRADNTTGFKGVGLHAQSGKYRARVRADSGVQDLGLFHTAEEAGNAVAIARAALHGGVCTPWLS